MSGSKQPPAERATVLTGAVQQSQIEDLKSQVNVLKEDNEMLKELVCADHPAAEAYR
ncbi:MAG: hypothetical protein WCX64_06665 [Candidatus Micrarchaeia archaeon]